jgi:hypothetical protein
MTEQEAEALATRLTRVWSPNHHGSWTRKDGNASYSVEISPGLRFDCIDDYTSFSRNFGLTFSLSRFETEAKTDQILRTGYIYCFSEFGHICISHSKHKSWGTLEMIHQFAAQYTPFFRRNCWLSGCPIEATAHEKAEWTQGFSREELEAWNLKI